MPKKEPLPLPSVEVLLFEAPLYTRYKLADDLEDMRILCGRAERHGNRVSTKLDAYCPACKQDTTYTINGIHVPGGDPWNKIKEALSYEEMSITCGRNEYHRIRYYFRLDNMVIEKVGQYPSLAYIAIDETRQKYQSVLRGENWAELYKAIGLAAHGEGIGSFVYLRRVFERLIQTRFDEFKASEGWNEEDFKKLRMVERIALLKDHLPASLVENRQLYGIFSKGIHELDNEVCLEFFDVGKRSIIMILEDDLKTQADFARKELAAAVSKFSGTAQKELSTETAGDSEAAS